jgi:hypothetical protein
MYPAVERLTGSSKMTIKDQIYYRRKGSEFKVQVRRMAGSIGSAEDFKLS